ncbi:hypothetical protein FXN63_18485 [Pigmentiphaga aceris]|uniref:Uncharacterized protein n=1 Tax=Pigmentiphaga aceris TaxID=1940612 RepID=A0A5C0B0X2_9BURK|nr:hypothetical protein [Pigmentiphaga aceris]QEI07606.1 hypothetical protein FXN63_18485 [Pigmentiphaga aceris]
MNEPTRPTGQPDHDDSAATRSTPDGEQVSPAAGIDPTPAPRRPPGSIRLWGFLLLVASAVPLHLSLVAPYLAAQANERVTLLGAKLLLLGTLLLMYGLPMLLAGSGFTRLRRTLPQLGKASSLDMVILVASMLIAYFAEHQLRVVLNGMGYPVPLDW